MIKFSFPDVQKYKNWTKELDKIRTELDTVPEWEKVHKAMTPLEAFERVAEMARIASETMNNFGVTCSQMSSRICWVLTPNPTRRRKYPIRRPIRKFELK